VERRFQGHTDIPLDDTGLAQAARAASLLAALRPSKIVSSDLQRAYDTAAALGRVTGLDVATDKDLRERGGGEWEGLTRNEIQAGWPREFEAWEAPGGEDVAEVAGRVAAAVRRWADRVDEDGLLVVASHGAAIRLGIARLMGLPEEMWPVLGGLGNCSWSVLEESRGAPGTWRLLEHNAGTLPEPVSSDDK
jgi:probable phosphoglycerate mutase